MKKRGVNVNIHFLIWLCLACLLTGCKANISSYGDASICISGLTDTDFYVTPNELAQMSCVRESERTEAYGPTLETFVEAYGHTLSGIKSVRVTASDDYEVVISDTTWDKYTVILSIANGNDALEESQQPMRLVIPGGASANWVRMVTKLEFTFLEDPDATT